MRAFLAARRLGARGGEEEARQATFDRIQRDGFQLLVGLPDARAQKAHGRVGDVRMCFHQPLERGFRQAERNDLVDGRGVGTAHAAVEHGDLAEDGARLGVRERQLAPFRRQHRKAHPAADHEIDLAALVAARENHLAGIEGHLAHLVGDGAALRFVQRSEKGCASEKIDNRGFGNHVRALSAGRPAI